ncbi:hypothetical protein [Paractinoplanes hotanensis]|uniref:Uncharacterized protein n=1 Tax=Paractinoplanes hotanensis TaxID=2906497 RepID=A0ABT0YFE0_9ACTN|nr:hypothetical protein [Actinoplanes hotanensis]MCM4084480.1 hypothetical protein [Actinoplanes hotanensis]
MTVTAVEITRRPAPIPAAPVNPTLAAPAAPEPLDVVIVDNVDALTRTNQRGCGDDNPYN